jgi:uncharacterized protein YbjT (DUF2867 family)
MKIAVAGATGRVGAHTVDILRAQDHEVVERSRATGVNLISGEGLAGALRGVEVVVDAATGPSPDEREATDFFVTAAGNLQAEAERAGVKQVVVVSIIGIERFSGGYNAAKVAHEKTHASGPVPARFLRAAQYHEFVPVLMDWGRQGAVTYVWAMNTQLVAARTVAEALADLAVAPVPEGQPVSEIAGPRVERLVEAARLVAFRRGDSTPVEEVPASDDADAELYATDGVLPGPGATLAGPAFEEWLESEVPAASAS